MVANRSADFRARPARLPRRALGRNRADRQDLGDRTTGGKRGQHSAEARVLACRALCFIFLIWCEEPRIFAGTVKATEWGDGPEQDNMESHQPRPTEGNCPAVQSSFGSVTFLMNTTRLVCLRLPLGRFPSEIEPYGVAHSAGAGALKLVRLSLGREVTIATVWLVGTSSARDGGAD